MRDDLHRTPALTRYWKTAVRHAERPADRDRVAYDLSRAALQDLNARIRPAWTAELKKICGGSHGQLFPETQIDALSTFECTAQNHLEQRLLEITRATSLQRPNETDVVGTSMRELLHLMVESGIEHVAAAVRQDKGPSQARQLRACLVDQQAKCSLELGQQKPPKKPKVKDLLNMEVSAS